MKHLATIQKDFLKEASEWVDLSIEQQQEYLKKHPASKKTLRQNKKRMRSMLGLNN